MRRNPVAFLRKASSVALGLASKEGRIEGARRLFAHSLGSLPLDELTQYLHYVPTLPDEAFADTRLFPCREAILPHLPREAVVAEVGTYEGDYARKIVETCAPKELHLIDIDLKPFKPVPGAIVHEGNSSS